MHKTWKRGGQAHADSLFFPNFSSCIYVFSFQRATPDTVSESQTKEKKRSLVVGISVWIFFFFSFFLIFDFLSIDSLNRSN